MLQDVHPPDGLQIIALLDKVLKNVLQNVFGRVVSHLRDVIRLSSPDEVLVPCFPHSGEYGVLRGYFVNSPQDSPQ